MRVIEIMALVNYRIGTYANNPSSTPQGASPCKGFYHNSVESLIRNGETNYGKNKNGNKNNQRNSN